MKHAKFVPFLLCLIVAMATGCIYDETEHCYSTLRFTYTGDTGDEGEFAKNIGKLDLYVFDENHQMVRADLWPYTLTESELKAQEVRLLLPPGKNYRVVCVGNAGENTTITDLTTGTYVDTKMHHRAHSEDRHSEVRTQDSLYHGTRGFLLREGVNPDPIELNSAHVDMIVEVKGYAEAYSVPMRGTESTPSVEHRGLPAWTDFDNKHSKHRDYAESIISMTHYPDSSLGGEDNDTHIHRYDVMRDVTGTEIRLFHPDGEEITQAGTDEYPAIPLDLDWYIENILEPKGIEVYDEDGDLLQEAFIPIEIEFVNGVVEVKIPEWVLKNVTPGYN